MPFSAGCLTVQVSGADGARFPVFVFYPSTDPERPEQLGLFTVDVALDGASAGRSLPLVVVSHGTGSAPLLFRTLAIHLARHGCVVALPEHPHNNRLDNSLGGTAQNLADRPRHIRAVLDWAFASDPFGPKLQPNSAAVIGHSLGAYTALAIAGGIPTAFPWESPDGQAHPVPVVPDDRVTALVLLAPAAAWFLNPGALASVRTPILMFTGGRDDLEIPGTKTLGDGSKVHMPAGHSAIITRGLPPATEIVHRVVPNAGHYSFVSPYPAAMTSPAFPPSQDPPGFDRVAFHRTMNAEILAFPVAHGAGPR